MSWRPGGSQAPPPKEIRETSDVDPGYRPSRWEMRDFALSYVILSVSFGILFAGGGRGLLDAAREMPEITAYVFLLSFLTAGVGFVVHELAHRMVAIRFGRAAAFRAHYGMLVLGIATALGGFIFAAPGGVYHRRDVPLRERGLMAVAGPVSNLVLAVTFAVVFGASFLVDPAGSVGVGGVDFSYSGLLLTVGGAGILINCILAGFNMLPVGPLDGGKVYMWSSLVYVVVAVPSILVGAASVLFLYVYV